MMSKVGSWSLLLVLGAIPALAARQPATQAKDPFLGNWLMDSDHSTFVPGPVPEGRTMTIEMKDGEFHHLTETPNTFLGNSEDIEYTAKFDGKDYPITGTGLDTVSLKRMDSHTIDRTGKVRGKESETCTMKVSPDGKTLTMTVDGVYNGTHYRSTQVFTRQ